MMRCFPSLTESLPPDLARSKQAPRLHPQNLTPSLATSLQTSGLEIPSQRRVQLLTHPQISTRRVDLSQYAFPLLTPTQANDTATNHGEAEVETETKKRKRSGTPEQGRSRKHRRQQQQNQTETLVTGMTDAVHELCSSLQPAPIQDPQQSIQQRKTSAMRLMEADGDFVGPEGIPVIDLFTSSTDAVDAYLAIGDKAFRTLYVKHLLHRSP
jgi:hypothetical protein